MYVHATAICLDPPPPQYIDINRSSSCQILFAKPTTTYHISNYIKAVRYVIQIQVYCNKVHKPTYTLQAVTIQINAILKFTVLKN